VKIVVLILLAAIMVSLFSGLFFLSRDAADSAKVLRALKIRVALSVALVSFLLLSYMVGWISPGPS
jgi:hypothetical protein